MSDTSLTENVVTRIAPSPTGFMHIGTARTALFSWLFARGRGGKFLLRIEDTDRARSTQEATDAIYRGMKWLGLHWDDEAISQFERAGRHAEVANEMLANGKAYKCYSTQDEIAAFRDQARAAGQSTLFRSPWRDVHSADHPDLPFVVRVKAPQTGTTVIKDEVQGDVLIQNSELDDMICLRSDGTPTYMLAVVVDDHDMAVTHVIRGDDHLTNAARQMTVYDAMEWTVPIWAHIPLIHGPDGKKLSKRHGALGIEEYQAMGFPASAVRNYLARLGWSHGDNEFFSDEQAIEWFDLKGIGKSPARLDLKKLENLAGQHIAIANDKDLVAEIVSYLAVAEKTALSKAQESKLNSAMYCLKDRARSFPELLEKAHFILTERPIQIDEKASKSINVVSKGILNELTPQLQNASWNRDTLEEVVAEAAQAHGTKLGKLAGPLRAALAGRSVTPSVFDMMLVLGREETILRLKDVTDV